MDRLMKILKTTGFPYAYDHFAEGESPSVPFICYALPQDNNLGADGGVYQKINCVKVELYTDKKDLRAEDSLENLLEKHGIFYRKSEIWIGSEKLYEVSYQFDLLKEATINE